MNAELTSLFSHVCGQGLDHTWMPGGLALPVCQRCTGLYVGAAMAFVLHLLFRPQSTPAWRWAHGFFLLQMVPFGYHWLPQGAVVRAMTGVLFAFGLVSYFWLLPLGHFRAATGAKKRKHPHWAHLSFLQTHGLESPCHVAWAFQPMFQN